MKVPQKIKHRIIIRSSNSISEYILKKTQKQGPEEIFYTPICQNVEAIQMYIDECIDKPNIIQP